MIPPSPRLAAVLLLLTLPAVGQELRLLAAPMLETATYDQARGRLVGFGFRGRTEEWDGSSWRMRSCPLLEVNGARLDFERAANSCLLVGAPPGAADLSTYRLHASGWEVLPSSLAPPSRLYFASCHDTARGGLVLFGGLGGAYLADTWTFDGTTWTQRASAHAPTARTAHAMACDEARSRVVLFGGHDGGSLLDDTWQWDGLDWLRVTPGQHPPARDFASLVDDPRRGRVVLFGGSGGAGLLGDLWEFDGTNWQAKSWSAVGPAPRLVPLGVFDSRLGECVFVGGSDDTEELHDAWSWNGVRWSVLHDAPVAPPWRSNGHVLAEPLGSGLLLFGGADATRSLDDMWRWDGTAWTEYQGLRPSARVGAATCSGLLHAFLFGGLTSTGANQMLLGDTWTWDRSRWSQVVLANGPTARVGAAMAYDLGRGEVVLFGGRDGALRDDTWTFDGLAWSQQQAMPSPAPREGARMAYDTLRQRTVLFSGRQGVSFPIRFTDTWEWDGLQWTQVATNTAPTVSHGLAMDFDLQLQQVVLVVGAGFVAPSELWRFDGADWHALAMPAAVRFWGAVAAVGGQFATGLQIVDTSSVFLLSTTAASTGSYGSACGMLAPEVAASQWPRLGSANFAIDVTQAPANGVVALLAANAPAAVPIAGCTLLVAPAQVGVWRVANGLGFASQPLPLPTASWWLGTSLYFQAATLNASAPAGFALSRGLQVTIGD